MGYPAVWKVLEEIVTDFKKRKVTVPAEIMSDLKSARTVINILKAEPSRGETMQEIDKYLGNVESYLVSEGQKRFGAGYIDEWLKRVDDARRKVVDEKEEESFVPGLPRQQKWIRITPSAELPLEKLKAFAENSSLLYTIQPDGSLLVSGEGQAIKDFVKKIAAKYKPKAQK